MNRLLCALALISFIMVSFMSAQDTTALWKEVEKAKQDGLPKTAVAKLEQIMAASGKAHRTGEWLRALSEKIALEGTIEGNQPAEKVRRLQAAMESAGPEARLLLRAVLAKWYWHYFTRNRWRFMNRTPTDQTDEADFTTWDLRKIFGAIDDLYQDLLKEREKLQKIPASHYADFLQSGTMPDRLRPTLYDFVAWEALDFYTSAEQAGAQPEDAFEIDAESAALAKRSEFLAYAPRTEDQDSPKLKALRIYQGLLSFHLANGNREALLDADLHRLVYVKNEAFGEEKNRRFRGRLEELLAGSEDLDFSSMIRYHLAEAWSDEGDLVKARSIALAGAEKYPKSLGGQACRSVVARIEAKSLRIQGEQAVPPGPTALRLTYKNFRKLYLRVYPDRWNAFFDEEYSYPNNLNDKQVRQLLAGQALRAWEVELPETPDYKERTEDIDVPALPAGYYRVFASFEPKFLSSPLVQHTWIWVSAVTLLSRPQPGQIDGFVLDAVSGEPVPGADVSLIYRSGPRYQYGPKVRTDADGHFAILRPGNTWDNHVHVRKGTDELFQAENVYSSERPVRQTQVRTVFFTDRSLYRPGQTVYFKGICVQIDADGKNYQVLPKRNVAVQFLDPNRQEIENLALVTNDFGSISGQFTAPKDRLTGLMTIEAADRTGATQLRVEEYKRPKFEVTLEPPATAIKLGGEVEVAGKAMAYTGAPVDGAMVRYRVVRQARWPYWWSWYFDVKPSGSQEIAHGKVATDAEGKFVVPFTAKPDPTIPESDDPSFVFQVFADVTDNAGETRSGSTGVTLGYAALAINLNAGETAESNREFSLSIGTATLDGKELAASGAWRILRLKEPPAPIRRDIWSERRGGPKTEQPEFGDNWRTWPVDRAVKESTFQTDSQNPFSAPVKLPAGLYKIEAVAKDAFGKEVKAFLPLMVLPERGSIRFGLRLPNLVSLPEGGTVEVGGTLDALWGTGYDEGRAIVEIEHRGEIVKRYWTPKGATQQRIQWPVGEDFRGGFTLHVTQVRENRDYVNSLHVTVPWDNKELALSFETFRDKMEPGAKETFRVKIRGKKGELAAAEMAAAMYDYSLDQFYPHAWSGFNFFWQDWSQLRYQPVINASGFNTWRDNWNAYMGMPEIDYLHFPETVTEYLFGYGFPGERRYMAMKSAGAGPPPPPMPSAAPAAAAPEAMKEEAADMATGVVGGVGRGTGSGETRSGSGAPPAAIDLSGVQARKNLNETAFFFPQLLTDADGGVTLQFTMPEALTKWKFLGFAHTPDCKNGLLTDFVVTRKELMVQPNPPRFLREGDTLLFSAKVVNMSDKELSGAVRLEFRNALNDQVVDAALGLQDATQAFKIAAGASSGFTWTIKVPLGMGPLSYTVVARAESFSDGETGTVPVLPSRIFLTESVPLHIRGPETKDFTFDRLKQIGTSDTLEPFRLTVQVASNPAWYAIQALPFLIEFPYECSEQVFNRLYANSLARHIANSDPKIERIFAQWRGTDALKSNLEKNEELKSVLLAETPWVLDAQGESAAKRRVGLLFEKNTIQSNLDSAVRKLTDMQLSNGAWPWFPGGRPSDYITLYIVTGYGKMKHFGVEVDNAPARRALGYLDGWIRRYYDDIQHKELNHLSSIVALYLYGRSFYLEEQPIGADAKVAVDYFLGQARKYWLDLDCRMSQGHLALALNRFGDKETARKIMASIKERSVSNEEMGMFWRELELSWWWFRAPIETQAVMIEAFAEVTGDTAAVEDCKVWLLKQKQTQDWKTTVATADAVYALVLRGDNPLASDKLVRVSLGGTEVVPEQVEAGTGFYEKQYYDGAIKPEMSQITMVKEDKGIAWGGVHFQYFEDMTKVTPHATNLSLEKKLFVNRDTPKGPVIEPVAGPVKVGDLLTVRVILRVDRDMEYVHLKDLRGSGLEPTSVLSGYRFQDGLAYYQSTKDTASHFFIDYLPKGTYVFEYTLRVQHRGRYQSGVAEIQCMYAPEFNSHSGSVWIEAE